MTPAVAEGSRPADKEQVKSILRQTPFFSRSLARNRHAQIPPHDLSRKHIYGATTTEIHMQKTGKTEHPEA